MKFSPGKCHGVNDLQSQPVEEHADVAKSMKVGNELVTNLDHNLRHSNLMANLDISAKVDIPLASSMSFAHSTPPVVPQTEPQISPLTQIHKAQSNPHHVPMSSSNLIPRAMPLIHVSPAIISPIFNTLIQTNSTQSLAELAPSSVTLTQNNDPSIQDLT